MAAGARVKVVIIGNSGAGKSSYAARLARLHDLVYLELDGLVWEPHRVAVARPPAAVRADLERFLAEHERWVIEGCDGDLAELALGACTELVFMNPGVEACLDHNRRRPWEPHKFDDPADQERMLPPLLDWVRDYHTRTGPRSYGFHRRLFDEHQGKKRELDRHAAAIVHVFPELDPTGAVRHEGGWTSETLEAGGRIVQLARTPHAAETLRRQARVLPELAPRLPAPIPRPELVSAEPAAIAYRKLDGAPCDPCGAAPGGPWPEQLGRFLRALHVVSPAAIGLPPATPAELRARVRADLARMRAHVAPRLPAAELARADLILAALLDHDSRWQFPVGVTHGDLGPEHVLVDPDGALAGVIDWEDVGAGDPAWDFAWWLHAMPVAGDRALVAYGGPTDVGFRLRAACLYTLMPWHEVEHGIETGDPSLIESGIAGARARLQ
jgi:aminoglycoside phosphotransferase (APT) family kinase protein